MSNETPTVSSPFAIFSAATVTEDGKKFWVTIPCEDLKRFVYECAQFCQHYMDKDEFDATIDEHTETMKNDERVKVLLFVYDGNRLIVAGMNVICLAETMEHMVHPKASKGLLASLNMNQGYLLTMNNEAKEFMET